MVGVRPCAAPLRPVTDDVSPPKRKEAEMNLRSSPGRRNRVRGRPVGRLGNRRLARLEALEDRLLLDASDPTQPPGFIDPTDVQRPPLPPGPDETGVATEDSTLSYDYLASLATATPPDPGPVDDARRRDGHGPVVRRADLPIGRDQPREERGADDVAADAHPTNIGR